MRRDPEIQLAPNVFPTGQPSVSQRALGLLRLTHPAPSALYVIATGLLALVASRAAHRPIHWAMFAFALIAVAASQVAIGSLNDYCDRALDAATNRAKPIVQGLVTPRAALILTTTATLLAILTFAALGPLAFLLGLLIEGLGLAYDLRFKGTAVSALLFAIYFPLFPLLAWAVFGRWQPFLPWLLPFGAALGIAMNIANTLPDLDADRAAGLRGLPHLLGQRRGMLVAWLTPPLVGLAMWLLWLFGATPAHAAAMYVVACAALLPSGFAALTCRPSATEDALRRSFLAQAVGVLLLMGAWIVAVAF